MTTAGTEERPWDLPDAETRQPGSTVENLELGKKIDEALAHLGDDQRMVFVLREYEGLEYSVIAEVMEVSEGTIKSRLHRAKEGLRRRLAPYLKTGS